MGGLLLREKEWGKRGPTSKEEGKEKTGRTGERRGKERGGGKDGGPLH